MLQVNLMEDGKDMVWNPSINYSLMITGNPIYGGKHYLYVSRTKYDGCENMHDSLSMDRWCQNRKLRIYKDVFVKHSLDLNAIPFTTGYNSDNWTNNLPYQLKLQ
jgi:hypothetical protein